MKRSNTTSNTTPRRIPVEWGNGSTTLFLDLSGETPEVIDYESSTSRLHEMCGGRNYYQSRSGCSGAGYFRHLGTLVPCGLYRTDTVHSWIEFQPVGEVDGDKVFIAVPYASHGGYGKMPELLREYPAIIKYSRKLVYCEFYGNFKAILTDILKGKGIPDIVPNPPRKRWQRHLKKTFWGWPEYEADPREIEFSIEHYDMCSMERSTPNNPWEFFHEELKEFRVEERQERLYHLLSVDRVVYEYSCDEKGEVYFVKKTKIGETCYRGALLPGDPLVTGNLTAGWQRVKEDILVRFYDISGEAHLVAYAPAKEACAKVARRLAARLGYGEEFISFVAAHEGRQYVEFEKMVPKALYLLDPATAVAAVRKGLAEKIRKDILNKAHVWAARVQDEAVLDTPVTTDDDEDNF